MSPPPGAGTVPLRAAVLTLALIMSQAVYAVVAWFVVGAGRAPVVDAVAVGPASVALAAGLLLVSWVLPPRLAVTAADPEETAGRHFRAWLVGQVLRESVGVVGLLATLLTGQILWVAAMATVATAALLVGWSAQRGS